MIREIFAVMFAASGVWGAGLGIDWGSEFYKSSFLVPGAYFKAVENQISKRKTHNMVSLCGEERVFEAQSAVKFYKKNCQTFSMLNKVLQGLEDPLLSQTLKQEEPFIQPLEIARDENGLVFKVDNEEFFNKLNIERPAIEGVGSKYLRLEEVMAMSMENNLENARRTANYNFTMAAMSIWDAGLPIKTRRLIQSAFSLVGLKLTNFVEENVAAAIYDSMGSQGTDESPELFYFINIGSSGSNMSILKKHFTKETRSDNSTHWIPSVTPIKSFVSSDFSGHLVDVCLTKHLLKAQSQYVVPPHKQRQLLMEAKRVKEILSASKEMNLNVEDFFDNTPLRAKVSRADFEEACQPLFAILAAQARALRTFAEDSLLKVEKAEILGGMVRVPRVQEILREELGVNLGLRINGDEGMSLGATVISVNSTAGLKIEKIFNFDGPTYGIQIDIREFADEKPGKSSQLFTAGATKYGSKKTVDLKTQDKDFEVSLSENPGNYTVKFNVTGLEAALKKYENKNITESKTHLSFELDNLGIPKLLKAELVLKENRTEIETKKIDKKNSTNSTSNDTSATNATEPAEEKIEKNVIYVLRESLVVKKVFENVAVLDSNTELFEQSKKLLQAINKREQEKRTLSQRRNQIESVGYKLRELSEDQSSKVYLSSKDTEDFKNKANEIEEYMDSDDFGTASIFDLEAKLKEVDNVLEPFQTRKREHSEREKVFPQTRGYLKNVTDSQVSLKQTRPWVPEEKFEELSKKIEEVNTWFNENSAKQEAQPLHEEPVVYVKTVIEKLNSIDSLAQKIIKMQKPKPAKNETKTEKKDPKKPIFDAEFLKNLNMTKEELEDMMKKYKQFDGKNIDDVLNDDKDGDEKEDLTSQNKDTETDSQEKEFTDEKIEAEEGKEHDKEGTKSKTTNADTEL